MANAMLKLIGITKRFGGKIVVHNLSLEIQPGEIFGLLGPNGSGKTTTIRMMTGSLQPDEGQVTVCGFDVTEEPLEVKKKIGVVPDADELVDHLTAVEFLEFVAALRNLPPQETKTRIQEWFDLFHLKPSKNQLLGSFSHGMRKKVQLIAALLHSPELLILDEPTTGLDPDMVITLKELMKRLKQKGTAIFLSTHHLEFAEDLCDRVSLMKFGETLLQGNTQNILHTYQAVSLEEAYVKLTQTEHKGEKIDALLDHW